MTVGEVYDFLQSRAPFETAEEWDNAGLLVGGREMPAGRILVALDITPAAVEAAKARNAGLIVSHHPVLFRPLKRLEAGSVPMLLAQAGIAAVCAHTNLDRAPGGVNDLLAGALGLTDVRLSPDGLCRIGTLPKPLSARAFAVRAGGSLDVSVRVRQGDAPILRAAVCGGAGSEYVLPLLEDGTVQAAVTGEVRHHEWLALPPGATLVEAGHYHTEIFMAEGVACWLREAFPQADVTVYRGEPPYETLGGTGHA